MEQRSITWMAEAAEGERAGGDADAVVGGVCTDSREMRAGELFVALEGERFDGHSFVESAWRAGASGVMVRRDRRQLAPEGCAAILVDDTRRALGRVAARYRSEFRATVIGVGGSNGKTTTKELLVAVLNRGNGGRAIGSEASYNNDVGVPRTLLRLSSEHTALVAELGTNHPGELAPLVRMAAPRHGVIPSIGREHLEHFRDLDGVLAEEGWLAELLPEDGVLFINADTPGSGRVAARTRARVVRVGTSDGCDWRVSEAVGLGHGLKFQVEGPAAGWSRSYDLCLVGGHQAINATLALAVAYEMGVAPEDARAGLLTCPPARHRMEPFLVGGATVLDDTYNANADSMLAALRTLRDYPSHGRRIAVLGGMAELGPASPGAHTEVGRAAATLGVDWLVAVGREAEIIAGAARTSGLRRVDEVTDVEGACATLDGQVRPGDVVLVKASRSGRLDRVCDRLRLAEEEGRR